MNFLLRTASPSRSHPLPPPPTAMEHYGGPPHNRRKALEGLVAEDPSFTVSEGGEKESGGFTSLSVGGHSDVSEEEGWIAIPRVGVPEDWSDALDVETLHSLDRSFVFPGEQLNILACLSTCKLDAEFINRFSVTENGSAVESAKPKRKTDSASIVENVSIGNEHQYVASKSVVANGKTGNEVNKVNSGKNFTAIESSIQMDDHKNQNEILLERFKNSHFFVRMAESDVQLWSKRSAADQCSDEVVLNTNIDRRNFDGYSSGDVARSTGRCSLSKGNIVVPLQLNVGSSSLKDPILEVLQFEKSKVRRPSSECSQSSLAHADPYEELLRWLFPLDNAQSPPSLSLPVGSVTGVGVPHHRSTLSASSSSQLFSFSNFRSYSMPSLPKATAPSPTVIPLHSKPKSSIETFDNFSSDKVIKSQDLGIEGYLSFRGVPFEPEQFSVQCGLEGIYFPGKRWRKKLEVIQPLEIHSYAFECNNENLLSVQIKNVSPIHIPDALLFIDAINIIVEEVPKSGPPLTFPLSCIETGNGHSLPNLPLRRGEEHSFILKPSKFRDGNVMISGHKGHMQSHVTVGSLAGSDALKISKISSGKSASLDSNTYAVLVSYRFNYTESKLFAKKSTSWHPHVPRDLMISVATEMSIQKAKPDGEVLQLPFQELTLQASNLTPEDLTLMILAPASFTAPPSVVPLNSLPATPVSSFAELPELMDRVADKAEENMQNSSMAEWGKEKENITIGKRSNSPSENATSSFDFVPNTNLGCSHLWLQSTVPLGCVPAQSSVNVKLEMLPLTDGIIALDTLQVAIKEKGMTYVPEHPLNILATSGISTGIV